MFTDERRTEAHDEIHRRDQAIFAHLLTPDLFLQAARLSELPLICSPLNLINLVWLAIRAARDPDKCFADILASPLENLRDDESFSASDFGKSLDTSEDAAACSSHDPRKRPCETVSEAAFSKARQRMPEAFWVALFILLGERFLLRHAEVIRWHGFRLMACDGTEVALEDWSALRKHFGSPRNKGGTHGPLARLVMLQYPLARMPRAYALEPREVGENTMARRLLQGLTVEDLVLLDAGFLCYGLLQQIQRQGAFFCLRLKKKLNLKRLKGLRKQATADDWLVSWRPKDSRGNWRREGLPKEITLRLLTYRTKGFRPLQLLTNVLDAAKVPYEQWWGLSLSEEGEVLLKGAYNLRWEIETTYLELKVCQGMEGGLRSRTPEGVRYEVAGHVLYYLLTRWLMVEAAEKAGVSPLRLSFTAASRRIDEQWGAAAVAQGEWQETLRQRLLVRIGAGWAEERPGRTAPRGAKKRRAAKRALDARAGRRKSRPRKPPKPRRWFGYGWTLAGPAPSPSSKG